MKLGNAFRIVTGNFSNTYKLLLYRLITGVVFFGLYYAVLSLGLHSIVSSAELKEIFSLIGEFFKALTSGDIAYLEMFRETFLDALKAFVVVIGENVGSIVGSVVGVCVLYLISRFLNGVALFAMGNIFCDKMTMFSRTIFSAAFFKNLGQAMLYQVVYVPIAFVYNVIALALCWFFFFFTPSLLPSWGLLTVLLGLSLSIAAFLCFEALKMTLISAWLPAVVLGDNVIGGLRCAFRNLGKGFGGRFSNYLMLVYLIVIANILGALFTLGSFLLITVPMSYLMLLCLQFICYFEDNGRKYYVSLHKIAGEKETPEKLGE